MYNSRLQLTSLTSGAFSAHYDYSATQNNGQIMSAEGVQYTYDSLNRLIAAATTDSSWGQAFTYDGFGNLTGQTQTKGRAPQSSWYVDPLPNRLGGFNS